MTTVGVQGEKHVRQEVYDPPAGGIWHVELGEPVLKQSRDDGVERG